MINGKRVGVVIPAAGSGRRMGGIAKQFLEIDRKPLIWYSLSVFQGSPLVDRIVIAGPAEGLDRLREIVDADMFSKVTAVVAGGEQRQDSVWNGICALPPEEVYYIAVHDAARPLVTPQLLEQVLRATEVSGAAIAAAPCIDTVKLTDQSLIISGTLDRSTVWFAQTPQAFSRDILLHAYEHARAAQYYGTDEAALVERAGGKVTLVPGPKENIKVTTEEDVAYLRFLLTDCR